MKEEKIIISLAEYEKLKDVESELDKIRKDKPFAISVLCYNYYGNSHRELYVIDKDETIDTLNKEMEAYKARISKEIEQLHRNNQALLNQSKSFWEKLWE